MPVARRCPGGRSTRREATSSRPATYRSVLTRMHWLLPPDERASEDIAKGSSYAVAMAISLLMYHAMMLHRQRLRDQASALQVQQVSPRVA